MGKPAEGFEGFEGGQTAGSNVLKNRWLGHVAARVVASCLGKFLERPAEAFEAFEGFEWFEGGQTASSNTLKNRWLLVSHVAARVVASCIGKACGSV